MNFDQHATFFWGLLLCLVVMLSPSLAQAQRQATGTVTNGQNKPVINAEVYILELNRGTVTNQQGHFSFDDLPARKLTFTVSHVGYQTNTQTIDLGKKAQGSITIQLDRRVVKNSPVLVTGNRVQKATHLPLSSTVIGSDKLASSTEPTLWDLIEKEPGVDLQTNGPGIERPVIRGLSTKRIKILNRGTEYDYQQWDPESGLSMDGSNTEQVEIIRGPATLMYGSGAMGGVISLAQDRPAPNGQTTGAYRLGLYSNTYGINNKVSLKSGHNNYFWGFSGSFDSHADYETGGETLIRNSRYNNLQLQANAGISRSWGTSRLTYEYLQHQNGIVENEEEEMIPGEEEEEKGREIERPYHNLVNHSLTSETNWYRGKTHLNLTLGLQSNNQQEFEPKSSSGGSEEEAAMDLTLNSFDYQASITQQMGPTVEVTTGVQGDLKSNESKGEETFVPAANYFETGLFAIANWEANDALTLNGGARYDFHSVATHEPEEGGEGQRYFNVPQETDREFSHASGSIGLSYHPADRWTIKSNLGIGYRTPNIAELTADGPLREVHRYIVGDNALNAETSLEGDLRLEFAAANFSLSASGFYNAINNYIYQEQRGLITVVPTNGQPETYPVFLYRQDQSTLYGGEAGLSVHPQAMPWLQLDSEFSLVIGRNEALDAPLPMMPAPSLNNTITLQKASIGSLHQARFSLSLRRFFKQDRTASFEEETPAYWLTDLSLGSQISLGSLPLQLTLAVNNLFNVQYISHLSLLKYEDIRNRGRNISLTARIPFTF